MRTGTVASYSMPRRRGLRRLTRCRNGARDRKSVIYILTHHLDGGRQSLKCALMSDALSLIADTGATGGLTGRDTSAAPATATIPDPSPSSTYDPEAYARGVAAQAQNRKFASLSIMDYCEPSRNLSWPDDNETEIILGFLGGSSGCVHEVRTSCYNGFWSLEPACDEPWTQCFSVPAGSGNSTVDLRYLQ